MNSKADSSRPAASRKLRWVEQLRDRSEVLVRPLSDLDRSEERRFLEGVSAQARSYRFLARVRDPSDQLMDRPPDAAFEHDVAFVAVVPEDAHERIVAMARYSVDASASNCECTVTVADAWRDRGLGTVLMRHLIDLARERGMRTMYSIDSVDNVEMVDFARHLGFETRLDPSDPQLYIHRLALQPDETHRETGRPAR